VQWTQSKKPVGLGRALLLATREAAAERPPAVNGRLGIIADARIDARVELVKKLNVKSGHGHTISPATADPELLLHAFNMGGDTRIDHLLGDCHLFYLGRAQSTSVLRTESA
jgi:hypothetical protein